MILTTLILPEYQVPEGESLDSYLCKLCDEGMHRRFPEEYRRRPVSVWIMSCQVLRQMGFAGYFLIVQDFINWARQHGIPVGPGRGSAPVRWFPMSWGSPISIP